MKTMLLAAWEVFGVALRWASLIAGFVFAVITYGASCGREYDKASFFLMLTVLAFIRSVKDEDARK